MLTAILFIALFASMVTHIIIIGKTRLLRSRLHHLEIKVEREKTHNEDRLEYVRADIGHNSEAINTLRGLLGDLQGVQVDNNARLEARYDDITRLEGSIVSLNRRVTAFGELLPTISTDIAQHVAEEMNPELKKVASDVIESFAQNVATLESRTEFALSQADKRFADIESRLPPLTAARKKKVAK